METIAIHEAHNSDRVIAFAKTSDLIKYTSRAHANKISKAYRNGTLLGVHLTTTGKLRATYVPR